MEGRNSFNIVGDCPKVVHHVLPHCCFNQYRNTLLIFNCQRMYAYSLKTRIQGQQNNNSLVFTYSLLHITYILFYIPYLLFTILFALISMHLKQYRGRQEVAKTPKRKMSKYIDEFGRNIEYNIIPLLLLKILHHYPNVLPTRFSNQLILYFFGSYLKYQQSS